MQAQDAAAILRKLPLFLFPPNLTFYLDNQSSHKQVLTLYNPYDFPVKFKIFCNAPNKYLIVDPEGMIKPRCCVDLVVRHTAPMIANCDMADKFRITMREYPGKQLVARRYVEAMLRNGTGEEEGRETPDPDEFKQLPQSGSRQQQSYPIPAPTRAVNESTSKILSKSAVSRYNSIPEDMLDKSMNRLRQSRYRGAEYVVVDKGGTNYVAIVAGIVCIIGLLLPTQGDENHRLSGYVQLSVNLKLIFSFVLGMVTIIVLRL